MTRVISCLYENYKNPSDWVRELVRHGWKPKPSTGVRTRNIWFLNPDPEDHFVHDLQTAIQKLVYKHFDVYIEENRKLHSLYRRLKYRERIEYELVTPPHYLQSYSEA